MSEAAPQAASGQAGERELSALRWYWGGGAYLIGSDDERGWRAARRDQAGGYRTGPDPDGLRAIREDYDLKPVPRDCADGGEP